LGGAPPPLGPSGGSVPPGGRSLPRARRVSRALTPSSTLSIVAHAPAHAGGPAAGRLRVLPAEAAPAAHVPSPPRAKEQALPQRALVAGRRGAARHPAHGA